MSKLTLGRRGSRLAGLAIGLVSMVAPSVASATHKGAIGGQVAQGVSQGASQKASQKVNQRASQRGTEKDALAELIETSGRGTVVASPDAMRVELGAEVQAKTAELARNELARKMGELGQAIAAVGEKGLVLQTSQLDLSPVYTQSQNDKPARLVGYRARNTLRLTLTNVAAAELGARAAKLLDAGVSGGANIVSGISFFLSRPEEAQAKALRLAAQNAQKNAQILAAALNLRVVRVHSIDGSPERVGPFVYSQSLAKSAETSIEPGEITISANVSARFHFTKQ